LQFVKRLTSILLILLLISPSFSSAASNTGSLHLSAAGGKPGNTITIYGSWFLSNEEGSLYLDTNKSGYYDWSDLKLTTTKSDYLGNFTASFKVPDIQAGTFSIFYIGASSADLVSFSVRSNTIDLSPEFGPQGTIVTITGTGFPTYESGTLYLDANDNGVKDSGESFVYTYSNEKGEITEKLTMPAKISNGTYYIRYAGRTEMDPVAFRIVNPSAALTLSTTSGEPGSNFIVYGQHFPEGESGYVYLDANDNGVWDNNEFWNSTMSDFDGNFSVPLMALNVSDGSYKIRYNGTTSVTPASYQVKSAPGIKLETATGRIGNNTITVNGKGFQANETGYVYLDANRNNTRDSQELYTNTISDKNGSFIVSLQVENMSAGTYYIRYSGTTSVAHQLYTVPSASMALSVATGQAGSNITITGKNLPSGETGNIYLDTNGNGTRESDEYTISTTSDDHGSFTGTFTVPDIRNGIYYIRYAGTTSLKEGSFEIKTPASISLDAASGERSSTITISGKHFTSYESGYVYLDTNGNGARDNDERYVSTRADYNGDFTASLTVPSNISGGTYQVRYFGSTSVNSVSYQLIVPGFLYLDYDFAKPGSSITVYGYDFPEYESGYVYLDINGNGTRESDEPRKSTYSSGLGSFNEAFTLPNIGEGTYSIRYIGVTTGKPASITLDATPPATPKVTTEVTDGDTSITGTAEAGTTINAVKENGTVVGTATTGKEGSFTLTIGSLKGGTTLTLTATDRAGNISGETKVTVIDITPPYSPIVYNVTDQSTEISGRTEANSLVKLYIEGVYKDSTTADINGIYKFPIAKLVRGTFIMVTSTDSAGNTSKGTTVPVTDGTPPTPPLVSVNEEATVISVQTEESYHKVTITVGTNDTGMTVYEGYSDALNNYSVTVSELKSGTIITASATDRAGNISELTTVVVKDIVAPEKPVVNEVNDKDTSVIGVAEANSTVEVKANGSVIGTGIAGTDGRFAVTIPVQKAGTELVVTATDKAGNVSEATTVVIKDVTAPVKPAVNEVTEKDTTVTGTAEAGSKVEVKVNGSLIGEGVTGTEGKFSVSIPLQKAGTELVVTLTDKAGNVSEATAVVVKDVTAPINPAVNEVTDKDTSVTGTAEAGSKVEVKVNGALISEGVTGTDGKFSVSVPVQKAGTQLVVTATDEAGNISEATFIVIIDVTPPVKPVVNEVTDKDSSVTGTAEAGSKVEVKVNGSVIGEGTAGTDGKFMLTIPAQKAGTEIVIAVTDKAGNVSEATKVVVIDVTAPLSPTVNEINDKVTSVTGMAEAGSKVEVKVNGSVVGEGTVGIDDKFAVTIPVQKAGTALFFTVTDKAGNTSDATMIVVSSKLSGWVQEGGIWYYYDGSTSVKKTGWFNEGGTWYYFNNSGAMQTGWQQVGTTWYYFKSSGAMVTGWLQLGSTWYYFQSSGAMAKGWQQLGSTWYYFQSSGAMAKGWQHLGSTWYYFQSSGAMQTGWLYTGSQWYYFQGSGAMQTGWAYISGKWYYFDGNGVLK
jgi:hypothetical protein